MAIVAQLVRASACGAEGRRFESGLSPHFILHVILRVRIIFLFLIVQLVSFGDSWLPKEIATEEHH